MTIEQAAKAYTDRRNAIPPVTPANDVAPSPLADAPAAAAPVEKRGWFATALLFTVEALGSIVLFILLAAAAYFCWQIGMAWWVANYARI